MLFIGWIVALVIMVVVSQLATSAMFDHDDDRKQ